MCIFVQLSRILSKIVDLRQNRCDFDRSATILVKMFINDRFDDFSPIISNRIKEILFLKTPLVGTEY